LGVWVGGGGIMGNGDVFAVSRRPGREVSVLLGGGGGGRGYGDVFAVSRRPGREVSVQLVDGAVPGSQGFAIQAGGLCPVKQNQSQMLLSCPPPPQHTPIGKFLPSA